MKCRICGNDVNDILVKKLRRGEGTVYYCSKCDYGMLEPKFKDAKDYYNEEYRKKFKDNLTDSQEENPAKIYQMRCEYQKDRLNIIRNFFDKKKTFLEIGSSAGQFLSKIQDEFQYVAGVELSKKCAEYTEQKWNIPVYTEELSQIEWNDFQFDNIGFFQVLEHIEKPKDFLHDVYKRLKRGGRVFIEIPSLDDALRKLWDVPAYEEFYYHEAHLSYFSEKSICKILEECGYKVEQVNYIQDYNFLNHVYWYFNNKPQSTCEFGLNVPKVDFKNGNKRLEDAGNEINMLFSDMNEKYFKILAKYKLTSNMFVVAAKN